MLPTMYGCSAQQSSIPPPPIPSLTINKIEITTKEYGQSVAFPGLTRIDPSQQINTVLNSTNNFTVPADGLAQYYTGSDPSKQVFHTMKINYTANNFDINDLSTTQLQAIYETTLSPNARDSGLNTWLILADPVFFQGKFVPFGLGGVGVIISTRDSEHSGLTRNDFFETSPTIGESSVLLENPNGYIQKTSKGTQSIGVERLDLIRFAAQNLGTGSSIDIKLKILLDDGTYAEGTQTITVPSGAVKENLILPDTFALQEITITPQKSIPPEATFPQLALPPGTSTPMVLNSANSFTVPAGGLYSQDLNNFDPTIGDYYRVANSFEVSFDTSTLDPLNYPEFELQCEIIVSSPGYPDEFTWYDDAFEASQTFGFEGNPASEILTGGVVSPLIAYPDHTDTAFWVGKDINDKNNITVQVRIQNSAGVWAESNIITITTLFDSIEDLE